MGNYNNYDLMDYDELEPEEFEEKIDIEYSLTSYGIDFDVSGLVRRFSAETIYAPEFQRSYVWNIRKASKFIESLLLGLPVPGIFLLREELSQKFLIIDGLQRLTSLLSFYKNNFNEKSFKLIGVHQSFNNKTIDELNSELRLKLDDTIIHATIIKPDDPKEKNIESVYLIFERLNTGGMNLSPQEIRNCIYQGEFLEFIKSIANKKEFLELLRIDTKRKKHEEIALRLLALTYNSNNYNGNMKVFLNDFIYKNRNLSKLDEKELNELFTKTISIIQNYIGPDLFRLKKGPINLAILDSVFVGIARLFKENIEIDTENIKEKLEDIINKKDFLNTIKTGKTHHTDSVKSRIQLITKKLKK